MNISRTRNSPLSHGNIIMHACFVSEIFDATSERVRFLCYE